MSSCNNNPNVTQQTTGVALCTAAQHPGRAWLHIKLLPSNNNLYSCTMAKQRPILQLSSDANKKRVHHFPACLPARTRDSLATSHTHKMIQGWKTNSSYKGAIPRKPADTFLCGAGHDSCHRSLV